MKRLIVASISGFLCGLICFGLASRGTGDFPFPVILQIVASRTLIGVAIGISCVRLGHWSIHGLVMGLLFSIPLAFSGLMAPENPQFSKTGIFTSTLIMGMVYGFCIELVTSLVFRARSR